MGNAKAPGKIIIYGEHVVLNALPALAVPAKQHCICRMTDANIDGIKINKKRWSWQSLAENKQALDSVHRSAKKQTLKKHTDDAFIAYVIQSCYANSDTKLNAGNGFIVNIESTIPVGAGMGSSAALISATIRCWQQYYQQDFDAYQLATYCEDIKHGKAGGLDTWVSWYNKAVRFVKENDHIITKKPSYVPQFHLVYTGKPQSTTLECVFHAQTLIERFHAEFSRCITAIEHALNKENENNFFEQILQLNQLLNGLGVVPKNIAEMIEMIEQRGGVAKISGAGSIKGEHAGAVIAWNISSEALFEITEKFGFSVL